MESAAIIRRLIRITYYMRPPIFSRRLCFSALHISAQPLLWTWHISTLVTFALVVFPLSFAQAADSQRGVKVTSIDGKTPAEFVAGRAGTSWAIVVGINVYQHVPNLTYATADAKSIAELFSKKGFKVTSLYDAAATRKAILHALGDQMPTEVGENDQVVIFFAGHGETRKFGTGTAMGYLLPVDAEANALSGTAIDMGLIQSLAQALPAKQVLFLIDSCYGGIAGQRFRNLSPTAEAYLKLITREKGRQLLTAGGADQQAVESPTWGHSAFTYYLLEGLGKGLADLNEDGVIPASELYTYLDQRVYAAAHLLGHTQRPQFWALTPEQGEFVFIPDPVTTRQTQEPAPPNTKESAAEIARLHAELEKVTAKLQQFTEDQSTKPAAKDRPQSQTPTPDAKAQPGSKSVKKDQPSLEQACSAGEGDKCFRLATRYVLGESVQKDIPKGAQFFEKGCRKGHLNSCTALGSLLWMGEGVPRERNLARSLWSYACKNGNQKACNMISSADVDAG